MNSLFETTAFIGGGFDLKYMIMIGACSALSFIASSVLKSRFRKYSQVPVDMSGAEIAAKMLADNNISDVKIISTPGQLTDHYNPANKTVNLSEVVYNERNAAAAAVAAHEVGHAIQHATAYSMLKMRSSMVPALKFGSGKSPYIIMVGLMLMSMGSIGGLGEIVTLIGIVLFSITTLFAFVTLPVEFDASSRALRWIQTSGAMGTMERSKAKSALNAAAMTYVVAAITSLSQLVYFIARYMNRR